MTDVVFLHGAQDRIQVCAQWITQAWRNEDRILVFSPRGDWADRLGRQLWIQPATGFTPHCRFDDPLAAETPVLLTDRLDGVELDGCLVNLSDELPPGYSHFSKLVEIVDQEESVKHPARERFKHYREQGFTLQSQDVSSGL